MRKWIAAALIAALLPSPIAAQSAPTVALAPSLQGQLDRIAAPYRGRISIAVIDPASGRRWAVDGDRALPLASVVKLAVAAKWLADVDAGKRRLDTMIAVPERLRLGSDGIGQMLPHPGVVLSAANLIELMLTVSDNSATDVLLEQLGGPQAVQRWMAAERLTGFRVDRPIANLLLDTAGLPVMPGKSAAETMWASTAPAEAEATVARFRFLADPRDTASANGVAALFERIETGRLLKPDSRAFFFDVLSRTRTGSDRLKGALPKDTRVEHKTGTLATVANDAGVIVLPDGRRIIVAVLLGGGDWPQAERARVIAAVGKAAFELAGK